MIQFGRGSLRCMLQSVVEPLYSVASPEIELRCPAVPVALLTFTHPSFLYFWGFYNVHPSGPQTCAVEGVFGSAINFRYFSLILLNSLKLLYESAGK